MYSVELSQKASKFLNKLDRHLSEGIEDGLKILAKEPVPHDSKFIGRHEGDKVFRIRVGGYRALYKIKEKESTVLITRIDKRDRVYQ